MAVTAAARICVYFMMIPCEKCFALLLGHFVADNATYRCTCSGAQNSAPKNIPRNTTENCPGGSTGLLPRHAGATCK
jgi:hypothetical protein